MEAIAFTAQISRKSNIHPFVNQVGSALQDHHFAHMSSNLECHFLPSPIEFPHFVFS